MTVLRALAALLANLPSVTLVYAPIHVGDIHQHCPDERADEGCNCGECGNRLDPDRPVLTARWVDDEELYAFAELVGHRFTDDCDAVHDAAREAMAHIALEEAAMRVEGDD